MSIEPNDTIFEAIETGLSSDGSGSFVTDGLIGDSLNTSFEANDVDFFQVELDAGDRLTADIDANIFGSDLDSVLRLFDSFGNEVAVNDDDEFGLDSFIDFTASVFDTYYVGVSSFSNFDYDPFLADSGVGGSTGDYTLFLSLNNQFDDQLVDI